MPYTGSRIAKTGNRRRVQAWRDRQKDKKEKEKSELTADKLWATNLAALDDAERARLLKLQDEMCELVGYMRECVTAFNAGKCIFADVTYEDVKKFGDANGYYDDVDHLSKKDIVGIHWTCKEEGSDLITCLFQRDPVYHRLGLYTRLSLFIYRDFIANAARYFLAHVGDENVDPVLAQMCIREFQETAKPAEPVTPAEKTGVTRVIGDHDPMAIQRRREEWAIREAAKENEAEARIVQRSIERMEEV